MLRRLPPNIAQRIVHAEYDQQAINRPPLADAFRYCLTIVFVKQ